MTFTGVYLLNLSRGDPNGDKMMARRADATGTDMVSSIQTRLSMEARRSMGHQHRLSVGSNRGDREGLIRAYDEEEAAGFGLTDLAEESDEDTDPRSPMMGSHPPSRANGSANGNHLSTKGLHDQIELQTRKSDER